MHFTLWVLRNMTETFDKNTSYIPVCGTYLLVGRLYVYYTNKNMNLFW